MLGSELHLLSVHCSVDDLMNEANASLFQLDDDGDVEIRFRHLLLHRMQ